MNRVGDYIATYSGRFWPLDPQSEDIDIETIAHALSNLCRFGGHTKEFYSVAQHSVLCSVMAPVSHKLETLLHDSPEGYLVDIPRPIKRMLPQYSVIEDDIYKVMARKFGFPETMSSIVKEIDNRMLVTEASQLLNQTEDKWWVNNPAYSEPYDIKIVPWSPSVSKKHFLHWFDKLTGNF